MDVRAAEPVAFIAGGDRSVSVYQGTFKIDASLSYDPTVCKAFETCTNYLTFVYDCSFTDGSPCCQFGSQNAPAMTLDLATAIDCYPAGADADVVTLFLQVQTTSALTALTGTATMRDRKSTRLNSSH